MHVDKRMVWDIVGILPNLIVPPIYSSFQILHIPVNNRRRRLVGRIAEEAEP